ncbi:MAG: glutamyl-tRNA reductase [Actinomycetota bacterium]|nr:glutamyl-tRNA reductase [Actinomycetota bacterium]
MPVLALGISHRRATVELLERLAFTDDALPKAYKRLTDLEPVDEGVILSTCNRVEVYASVPSYHAGFQALKRFLADSAEMEPDDLAEPLYSHYEDAAAEHLFNVAAGLDSMVLGEPQILTQVRAAHRSASAENASGPVVSSLFAEAARAGRRVRAETGIGASPHAFVEAGIDLAERALGPLQKRRALVVGAGSMANLAVEHLRERGVRDLHILNRSSGRAERLASRAGAGASSGDLSSLRRELAKADLVVSLTGAPSIVISRDDIEAAAPRERFILDLAVPRDVDPAVQEVAGVELVDLFDVRGHLERTSTATEEALAAAREIVTEEVRRSSLRRRSDRVAPLIRALLARGDEVRAAELRRFASQLSGLSVDQREAVERLAEGIVAKLLHPPVVALKERAAAGSADETARMLAELFRLGPPEA